MAGLQSIDHVILVMLENRSFDHLLGFLYPKSKDFDGLDGTSPQPRPLPAPAVSVFRSRRNRECLLLPVGEPAEGFVATTSSYSVPPLPRRRKAANDGFVTSFARELAHPAHPLDPKLVGAQPSSIMGMYAPETLPVLCGLAKGFAVL